MAKCKLCKANIPDGMEYCKDCQDKEKIKSNESYLDSLLSSVKNTTPSVESVYKKKNSLDNSSKNQEDDKLISEFIDDSNEFENLKNNVGNLEIKSEDSFDDVYKVDISDLEDFEKYDLEEDLNELEDDILISDEELFGEDISHLFSRSEEAMAASPSVEEDIEDDQSDVSVKLQDELSDESAEQYEEAEAPDSENVLNTSFDQLNPDSRTINFDQTDEDSVKSADIINSNMRPEEISERPDEDSMDLDLDELLNSLDSPKLQLEEEEEAEDLYQAFVSKEPTQEGNRVSNPINSEKEATPEFETMGAEDDDFLSLLNQMSFDDPAMDDVKTINELLKDSSATKAKQDSSPSDVGEVFSDALKVVSSLKDYEFDEDKILNGLPDNNEKGKKPSLKNKKALKEEKSKKGKNKKVKKEKTQISLWKRLFGNVKNDKTAAKHEEEIKVKSVAAEPSKKSKGKGKGKKGSAEVVEDEESFTGKKAPKEKAVDKKAAKKEKAEKKKKSKEIIQVIDEIDEDPGRINRMGAAIVFIFFGILAAVLILGAQLVSYSLSIEHATTYFGDRKYTQAYNEVYGVDIKDEDIVIYDKIMTVMYVNKQLNSYNSYYAMQKYPEALDSLLKGLSRYDKYIELATYLGIESDLDYVRSQLLAELSNIYLLSEKEAIDIINSKSMEEYSLAVYDVVKKMNN